MKKIVALCVFCLLAWSKEYEVMMLDKGDKYYKQFEPMLLFVKPGDTVTFKTTGSGAHNSESIEAMIPKGAKGWKGDVNKDISVTFEKEGFYGYKCYNHHMMGMVGAVVVGNPANLEEAKKATNPLLSQKRFEEIFSQIK